MIAIKVTDKTILNHTSLLMYAILTKIENYEKWWSGVSSKRDAQGDYVEVKTLAGTFTLRILEVVENKRIVLVYSGLFEGEGIWNLEAHGAACKVAYEVNLRTKSKILSFVNKFRSIEVMHSKRMKEVFITLDRHISNYHRKEKKS
ncbi:MAG: hypothetical protein KU37_02660 [Sulfuricurvum sp. PC08-66]|nr:MAG: hypothetical protein KU37_02660 [Sulfuricurvum sp. PC08-66]